MNQLVPHAAWAFSGSHRFIDDGHILLVCPAIYQCRELHFVVSLKERLPEAWSWVMASLRQDHLVWDALESSDWAKDCKRDWLPRLVLAALALRSGLDKPTGFCARLARILTELNRIGTLPVTWPRPSGWLSWRKRLNKDCPVRGPAGHRIEPGDQRDSFGLFIRFIAQTNVRK
jgi:hypothetical protein